MSADPTPGPRRRITRRGCIAFVAVGLSWALYAVGGGALTDRGGAVLWALTVGVIFAAPFVLLGLQHVCPRWWYEPWQCRRCGYDLRGTPDHAPCPECGGACRRAHDSV